MTSRAAAPLVLARFAREHLAVAAARGRVHVLAGRARGQGNLVVVEADDPARRRRRRGRVDAPAGGDRPGFHVTSAVEALRIR